MRIWGIVGIILLGAVSACAYRFGPHGRQLPGGHKKAFVQLFENRTQEVGIEADWTNAFIEEMSRSGLTTVTNEESAEVIIVGVIHTVDFQAKTPIQLASSSGTTTARSMYTEYQTRVTIVLKAMDKQDKELWQGQFNGEKNYKAPQLTLYGLRTANPLYNQSARKQTLKTIAKEVAFEAIGSMTENF